MISALFSLFELLLLSTRVSALLLIASLLTFNVVDSVFASTFLFSSLVGWTFTTDLFSCKSGCNASWLLIVCLVFKSSFVDFGEACSSDLAVETSTLFPVVDCTLSFSINLFPFEVVSLPWDDTISFWLSFLVLSSWFSCCISTLSLDWLSLAEVVASFNSLLVLSAAFASWFPRPKINVVPTKIDAVPTVYFLIENLFNRLDTMPFLVIAVLFSLFSIRLLLIHQIFK